MTRKVRDSVVVVTGASGGVGRATARAFAARGAAVVLAARRAKALEEVRIECERRGGMAFALATDVTDLRAVEALARSAVERYGRIDAWINAAAVALVARFEDSPPEVFRRVVETSLLGTVHGARAALPVMQEQGGGVLVNVSSIVAVAPRPYRSACVAARHAVRGFTESLRMELALDGGGIHVCHLMPVSVDTPHLAQAANYTGRLLKPVGPLTPPERVATAIVRIARRPRFEVTVGIAGRLMRAEHALVRPLYERVGARRLEAMQLGAPGAAHTDGAVFAPSPRHALVRGTGRRRRSRRGLRLVLASAALLLPLTVWLRLRSTGVAPPPRRIASLRGR